ncbi:unnamed protein product [Cunninghamella blakesleeana]
MYSTHSLLECPLYNSASLIINTQNRIVLRATKEITHLLNQQDPTGTKWPTKEDQHLCFTTLIHPLNHQPIRLLTCEHINENKDEEHLATTTTIFCADISYLETLYLNRNMFKMMNQSDQNIILRLNPYGIIQSVFSPDQSYKYMSGKPLMKYVLNDDIPILCKGLRQVTQYHMDDTTTTTTAETTKKDVSINNSMKYLNYNINSNDHDDDDEFTMVTFDIRCYLSSSIDETNLLSSNDEEDDEDEEDDLYSDIDDDDDDSVYYYNNNNYDNNNEFRKNSIYYHCSTIVTSAQDIICIMRPSDKNNHSYTNHQNRNSTIQYITTKTQNSDFSIKSNATCFTSSISNKISPLFQSTKIKLKSVLHKLQQTLWDCVEKGLLMVAHYIATVMVLALQCYRISKHPSFWLETSELFLRCLVAETKSRPEINKLFSWLEWSGLKAPRKLFGFALDHGSELFIHFALRSRVNTFL